MSNLATALASVQAKIGPKVASKQVDYVTNKGQRIKYAYAPLEAVWDREVREALSEAGLAVTHYLRQGEKGVDIVCRLMHSEGEVLESSLPVNTNQGMQSLGSDLTYLRRYLIAMLVGIVVADEDTDNIQSVDTSSVLTLKTYEALIEARDRFIEAGNTVDVDSLLEWVNKDRPTNAQAVSPELKDLTESEALRLIKNFRKKTNA